MSDESKVLIGIPTGEFARRAEFYSWLYQLKMPGNYTLTSAHGQSPARGRNHIIQQALDGNYTHVFFIDDDMCLKPDTLLRLLAHNVDMVSGLYVKRDFPHLPIMFDASYNDGRCKYSFLHPGRKGLIEVVNCGLGCALIKTEVFIKMRNEIPSRQNSPTYPWITLGELELDHWCDDIAFFNRALTLGYKLFMDLECPAGHMGSATFWPDRDENGDWFTIISTNGPGNAKIPQTIPTQEQIDENLRASGLLV